MLSIVWSCSSTLGTPTDTPAGTTDIPPGTFVEIDPADYTNVIYIDPSQTTDGDGTMESPHDSFDFLTSDGLERYLEGDTLYLVKRGTELVLSERHLSFRRVSSHAAISAYGEGERPLLRSILDTDQPLITGGSSSGDYSDIIVDGLHLFWDCPVEQCEQAPSGLVAIQTSEGTGDGTVVQDCELHGTENNPTFNGLRYMGVTQNTDKNLRYLGNEVYYIADDGVITHHVDSVEVAYNYIHNVNQNYNRWPEGGIDCTLDDGSTLNIPHCPGRVTDPADGQCADQLPFGCSGDVLQLIDGRDPHVHHNLFDKSTEGNKFNIIISSTIDEWFGALVEHNELYGPATEGGGATAIGIYGRDHVIIRHNKIHAPANAGIYTNFLNSGEIYGNYFDQVKSGINSNVEDYLHIFNNVFYKQVGTTDVDPILSSGSEIYGQTVVRNNIFIYEPDVKVFNQYGSYTASHNFYSDTGQERGEENVVGDPLFVNVEEGDFCLQSDSPAIDKGIAVDISWSVVGSAPDMGICEYGG